MKRAYYANSISNFLASKPVDIIGEMAMSTEFDLAKTQSEAWKAQICLLQATLTFFEGTILFEYSIPRMGKRVDTILLIENCIFVLEFKIGEKEYLTAAIDQVWDYALDLKNFHEESHELLIAPILIATGAQNMPAVLRQTPHSDNLLLPIKSNGTDLKDIIEKVLNVSTGTKIQAELWLKGKYSPTPTIIEAAMALYSGHSVSEISRSDAAAKNLSDTSLCLSEIIDTAQKNNEKVICFVTGVPGAGKTLVGLDIATKHFDKEKGQASVFLSGNGPLVAVLREALTRDRLSREKSLGKKTRKGEVLSEVKVFIQNVHHFRDEALQDSSPPFDHVAIFDEAQRAWNLEQTAKFMKGKKGYLDFKYSEPEFLISYLDRHKDWAVVVCLIGGGQEINTGEAGISEWVESLNRSYPEWHVYVSPKLTDSEYSSGKALANLKTRKNVFLKDDLHLSVSLRSFRAENLSAMVKAILDMELDKAKAAYQELQSRYPLVLTRDLLKAKNWLRQMARGNERYGIVVSSQAQRLKPYAIDVRSPMDPVHWFLQGKEDVRSSFYLEDVATEFHVQGLELDWACVTWDGDFRYSKAGWGYFSFVGDRWNFIKKDERKLYLKNAYRVLLTRARQGMVICVPAGEESDPTRMPEYYNETFEYLKSCGIPEL